MAGCGTMHIAIARGKLRWLVYPLLGAVLGGAGNSSHDNLMSSRAPACHLLSQPLVTDRNRLGLVVG